MTDAEIHTAVMTKLAVSVVLAGRALGLGPYASREAAGRGDIPTIDLGKHKSVPTSWLRKKLGLVADAPTTV
jgi:hypothetical protein